MLFLLVIALLSNTPERVPGPGAEADHPRHGHRVLRLERVPAPRATTSWSGYAFDACRAPSQAVMDRWWVTSPFTGVGIYLGGIHRACEQRYLTAGWVTRQRRTGWNLLPIWVGPQASCTGYDHRIDSRPGPRDGYGNARAQGLHQARRAAAAAHALGLPAGQVLFYDIEPFSTDLPKCKWSSLGFLEEWTEELHRQGYRSGVYSYVGSAIALLSRTHPSYTRPDAAWYAWIEPAGSSPHEYVAAAAFPRSSRVHQYALDTPVEFGGVRMDIDWDYVSLGATSTPTSAAGCDARAARVRPRRLAPGARGPLVRVAQCLVLPGRPHPLKTSGRFDGATVRAVRRFQQRRGLPATGTVDRPTWTSLLARGRDPVLRDGSSGDDVRRLQRTLNVALDGPRLAVDGDFGKGTARAVRHYRARVGLRPDTVVTARVWRALDRGRTASARVRR
ncbi:MAG TPA: glycoside hydrolase domain-containing protein [Nocardioides sp.]|nr:glycoside hydrolase domain-containing protein [Nocardioides sp.]